MWPLLFANLVLLVVFIVITRRIHKRPSVITAPTSSVPSSTKAAATKSTLGRVLAVCKSQEHVFSKTPLPSIYLIAGLGVEGDCHLGRTVQHRSRKHIRPVPVNLRQVHLIHSELFHQLSSQANPEDEAHIVKPGDLGENITTQGIDLLSLGEGTRLHFLDSSGDDEDDDDHTPRRLRQHQHPVVRVTGLRNPCPQIQKFQRGLQEKCLVRDAQGNVVERKAGVMSVVEVGGHVTIGSKIVVEAPAVHIPLSCV
ncbi:hypothetical protein PWT90_07971 [Aphanocladium album]|nr:hypothetical protein PWT90_07971 [Aphanocladium album]